MSVKGIKVIKGKVETDKQGERKVHLVGAIVTGLSEEDEARLIRLGFAENVDTEKPVKTGEVGKGGGDKTDGNKVGGDGNTKTSKDNTNKGVTKAATKGGTPKGKTTKGKTAAKVAAKAADKKESAETETKTAGTDLNININPDDLIQGAQDGK
jgi:hypothetical protein